MSPFAASPFTSCHEESLCVYVLDGVKIFSIRLIDDPELGHIIGAMSANKCQSCWGWKDLDIQAMRQSAAPFS